MKWNIDTHDIIVLIGTDVAHCVCFVYQFIWVPFHYLFFELWLGTFFHLLTLVFWVSFIGQKRDKTYKEQR